MPDFLIYCIGISLVMVAVAPLLLAIGSLIKSIRKK